MHIYIYIYIYMCVCICIYIIQLSALCSHCARDSDNSDILFDSSIELQRGVDILRVIIVSVVYQFPLPENLAANNVVRITSEKLPRDTIDARDYETMLRDLRQKRENSLAHEYMQHVLALRS